MSLRDRFQEYYRPTPDQFKQFWSEGLFIPDANVLLDMYRLKQTASRDMLNIFKALGDRFWVPDRAGMEYSRRRNTAIKDEQKRFDAVLSKIDTFQKDFSDGVNHCYFEKDTTELLNKVEEFSKELRSDLEVRRQKYPNLLEFDTLFEELNAIIGDNISAPFDENRMAQIRTEGDKRYADQTPPGYKDEKKTGDDKYGDYIIWEQIIEKASEWKKPIIFITRDTKEDWYIQEEGRTIGPRTELIKEMRVRANVAYYQYRTAQFIEHGAKFFGQELQPDTLKEVRDVAADATDFLQIHQHLADHLPWFTSHTRYSLADAVVSNDESILAFLKQYALLPTDTLPKETLLQLTDLYLKERFPYHKREWIAEATRASVGSMIGPRLDDAEGYLLRKYLSVYTPDRQKFEVSDDSDITDSFSRFDIQATCSNEVAMRLVKYIEFLPGVVFVNELRQLPGSKYDIGIVCTSKDVAARVKEKLKIFPYVNIIE